MHLLLELVAVLAIAFGLYVVLNLVASWLKGL